MANFSPPPIGRALSSCTVQSKHPDSPFVGPKAVRMVELGRRASYSERRERINTGLGGSTVADNASMALRTRLTITC
jgi:hypothetical protein